VRAPDDVVRLACILSAAAVAGLVGLRLSGRERWSTLVGLLEKGYQRILRRATD